LLAEMPVLVALLLVCVGHAGRLVRPLS